MKKILIFLTEGLLSVALLGQVPGTFNYQAVLRNATGNIRANTNVNIDIVLIQGNPTGNVVYSETYDVTTNAYGLVNLEIGSKKTSDFAGINWANGPYFLQISVDGVLMGTSQLLSVPYALYANSSGSSIPGPKGDTGIQGPQGPQGIQGLKGQKGDTGTNGKSAYQIWLDSGNTGTVANFILSLKGVKGDQGLQGEKGDPGTVGKSAYQVWLDLGNVGTEANYMASLKGDPGIQGPQGIQGEKGDPGIIGKSAYQVWLDLGNVGTEANYIASLKGVKGDQGIQGLKGDAGDPGIAFDDLQVLTNKTWTSSKINTALSTKANTADIYTKTNMQTSGGAQLHWNNVTNKPALFDGAWSSLIGKPSTLSGYGITDAALSGHTHNNATINASGFMSYVDKIKLDTLRNYTHPATHDWAILTNTPFSIVSPLNGQMLKYNLVIGKWENWTPNYLTSETQQLSLSNNQLTISGTGNTVTFTNWDTDKTDDVVIMGDQTINGNKTFSGSIIASNTIIANNGVNANNKTISNIATPIANKDAVPKIYVDSLFASLNLKIQVLQGVPVNQLMLAGATPTQLIAAGAKVADIVAAGGSVNGLTGTAFDLDGNTFKWIGIGNQVWMAENLKSIHYRNGDLIPNVTDNSIWASLTTGAYCNYNNDVGNVALYGRLYNNYTVMDSRNVCPKGWHVPSQSEFIVLETALGGDTLVGGRMKEVGTTHWHSPNVSATNSSGFLGLPSGNRHGNDGNADDGSFKYLTICGCYQSSTEYDATRSYHFHLLFWRAILESVYYSKAYGLSIRCLKD